eukprot:231745-Heterocapsa_arctica.AAC.1
MEASTLRSRGGTSRTRRTRSAWAMPVRATWRTLNAARGKIGGMEDDRYGARAEAINRYSPQKTTKEQN